MGWCQGICNKGCFMLSLGIIFHLNSSPLDKMAAISQKIWSDVFSLMKSVVFHWRIYAALVGDELTHLPMGDFNEIWMIIFKLILAISDWGYLLWNCSQMNATGSYWQWVNTGSANRLGNQSLLEPISTQTYVMIWPHYVGHNEIEFHGNFSLLQFKSRSPNCHKFLTWTWQQKMLASKINFSIKFKFTQKDCWWK